MAKRSPLNSVSSQLNKKLQDIESNRVEDDTKRQATMYGLPYIDLSSFPIDTNAVLMIDEEDARKANAVVITKMGSDITLATVRPSSKEFKELFDRLAKKFNVKAVVVSLAGLEHAYERYDEKVEIRDDVRGIIGISNIKEISVTTLDDLKKEISAVPTTELVDAFVAGALAIEASDIHLEPKEKDVRLRYRIDGLLTDIWQLQKDVYKGVLDRIKLHAGLKINVHTKPQDGRFTVRSATSDIEIRVSVLPEAYGEGVVMRVLNPKAIRQKLEELGMREDTLGLARELLKKTTGSILTSGPTGSGKTTTLYAFVQHINSADVKIITIEDPIEYHLKGINQTQTNMEAGYTFSEGLRAIVRQDPDVILVGEIRDRETAQIAMQSALTGHLMLSTIHTNSAAGVVPRLIDLGVKPVTVGPAVNAAMAQRLVRRLCEHCKQTMKISDQDFNTLSLALSDINQKLLPQPLMKNLEVFVAKGCEQCGMLGYKGRIGIYEIFRIDSEIEKMISNNVTVSEIESKAKEKGMVTLMQDGLIKVLSGLTSIEEVLRVTGE